MSFPRDESWRAGCLIIFKLCSHIYRRYGGVYPSLPLEQAPTGLTMFKTDTNLDAGRDHRRTGASRGAGWKSKAIPWAGPREPTDALGFLSIASFRRPVPRESQRSRSPYQGTGMNRFFFAGHLGLHRMLASPGPCCARDSLDGALTPSG